MIREGRVPYDGVTRADARGEYHQAFVRVDGERVYLGTYRDVIEAAIARDRAVLHFELGLPLNFPDEARARGPASPTELRAAVRLASKAKRGTTSRYMGVSWRADRGKWLAKVYTEGVDFVQLGSFKDEKEAALAHDRGALYLLGKDAVLNFPELDPKPASPEELRKLGRRGTKTEMTSRFRGVWRNAGAGGGWQAAVLANGERCALGVFDRERDAAIAYDRGARFLLGDDATLNFPDKPLPPASPQELRREGRKARRTRRSPSAFFGVLWNKRYQRWSSAVRGEGRTWSLGYFAVEEDAAIAYDRAARHFDYPRDQLNFPERKTKAAHPETIRAELWAAYKDTTTSKYTGVYWSEKARKWVASLNVEGKTRALGLFDDEVKAARVHDRAASRLTGTRRLNFERRR